MLCSARRAATLPWSWSSLRGPLLCLRCGCVAAAARGHTRDGLAGHCGAVVSTSRPPASCPATSCLPLLRARDRVRRRLAIYGAIAAHAVTTSLHGVDQPLRRRHLDVVSASVPSSLAQTLQMPTPALMAIARARSLVLLILKGV